MAQAEIIIADEKLLPKAVEVYNGVFRPKREVDYFKRRLRKSASRLGRNMALYSSTACGSSLSSAMMMSAWATAGILSRGTAALKVVEPGAL